MQQGGVPLPLRIDAGESAIVQFVADVEGELQVKPVRIGFADRNVDRPDMQGGAAARNISRTVADNGPTAVGSAGSTDVGAKVTGE